MHLDAYVEGALANIRSARVRPRWSQRQSIDGYLEIATTGDAADLVPEQLKPLYQGRAWTVQGAVHMCIYPLAVQTMHGARRDKTFQAAAHCALL